jgi:hypothetical protein
VLDPDSELSCGAGPWRNLLIEGDNFDALRYLRMTHAGQVKCIYIDPPYNTGNKDFIYNDRFVDQDDLYKHSKWLEFLHRRLLLARDLPAGCAAARLASYQVFPPDLNNDEKAFAQLLDSDLDGIVEWWHRNEPRKPWSIGLVLPDGRLYYPDFAVKVKGRTRGDGILLVEVKGEHLINSQNSHDKAVATHKLYRAPLMVTKEAPGRWMTLRYNDKTGKNEPDAVFRLDALAQY